MARFEPMEPAEPKYRSEFLKSPHHAVFGLLTIGAGFVSAALLPLIVGGTLYALGWIYLPDAGLFRRWVDRRREEANRADEMKKVAQFVERRNGLISSLSAGRRQRYEQLAQVCHDIEGASADNLMAAANPDYDPRLRKLDELMWTYLRLLGIEETLERFLETERGEDVPGMLAAAEEEAARLSREVDELKKQGSGGVIETKQRYLGSRRERLEVLRKRRQRCEQGQENLALVLSEQERLDQQIKLIRADAVATKNAETLTARIDATVEHLDQTNKWISELDEFKDLVGDMPATELRVGFEASPPPPLPPGQEPGVRVGAKQKENA